MCIRDRHKDLFCCPFPITYSSIDIVKILSKGHSWRNSSFNLSLNFSPTVALSLIHISEPTRPY
ncbi:hypothetical protein PVA38_11535 [Streptococcus pneumoniae D39]|nr:hypothetical protein PVA38_11535 [Streptococcus pneumoniae D39]